MTGRHLKVESEAGSRAVNFSKHRQKQKTILHFQVSHPHRFHMAVKYPSLYFEAAPFSQTAGVSNWLG